MNSTSITDYILKLEKLCDEQAEQARTLIFNEIALKKKLREAKREHDESATKKITKKIDKIEDKLHSTPLSKT
jgi:hypothetical protein